MKTDKFNQGNHLSNIPQQKPKRPSIIGQMFKFGLKLATGSLQTTVTVVLTVLVLIVVLFLLVRFSGKENHVGVTEEKKFTLSPTQIKSLEDIGEWEFLSIADEELVDTVSHGFFGDDRLVRIYFGTLRLGVNMHEVHNGWIRMDKDTVVATLPPIKLLDTDFIDEARTKSFYEDGDWTQADREALYKKAYDAMYSRCYTSANIKTASENARIQLTNILRSMGYDYVKIAVSESPGK